LHAVFSVRLLEETQSDWYRSCGNHRQTFSGSINLTYSSTDVDT